MIATLVQTKILILQSIDSCNDKNNNTETTDASFDKPTSKRKYNCPEKLTRKRLCYPEKWERNVLKKSVNAGKEYTSLSTKKLVPARKMRRPCGPGCQSKCYITEERRKLIFEEYWRIPTQSAKYDFIARYVTESKIENNVDKNTRKNYSKLYTLKNHDNEIVPVCSTMFLNTLGLYIFFESLI